MRADILKLETIAVFLDMAIETLSLHCYRIDTGLLQSFIHVKNLYLRSFSLKYSLEALEGLGDRNISLLSLGRSNPSVRVKFEPQNYALNKNNTKNLAKMCVEHLDLKHNLIIFIELGVFGAFRYPECLKILDLSENPLSFATHPFTFFSLARFPQLQYINISPGRYVARKKRETTSNMETVNSAKPSLLHLSLLLPKSVEIINASFTKANVPNMPNVNFTNGIRLKILDISYFGTIFCDFQIFGLHNLKDLNISGFDCSGSIPKLFHTFPNLEVLTARDCKLGHSLHRDVDGFSFRSLKSLRSLDLSNNYLISIPRKLFIHLIHLERLVLSNNKLTQFPKTTVTLKSLSYLDLSANVLGSLEVDGLARVSLRLDDNPLVCTCSSMLFLNWFFNAGAHIVNNRSLSCTLNNGSVTAIWKLKPDVKNMSVECVSRVWLVLSVVGCSLLLVSMILGVCGFRYRWNIKYWLLTKCRKGPAYDELPMEQYKYDAFVAYNHQNYQWACITLRRVLETENQYVLCLHDRDFPVAVSIQQNIVDAINNSKRVILVVNRAFLVSDWCEFEIEMAGMRMVRDGRDDSIIVIMMEEIPVKDMPSSLLNLWRHVTFLMWTNDQADQQLFWERLLEVMSRR